MKMYVLSLALSLTAGIACGQVKLKEYRPLLQDKKIDMPVLDLDTTSAKYRMPTKKYKKIDSLAPMPGTQNINKKGKSKRSKGVGPFQDTLKVKDFKLKIDSLYPKK